MPTNTFLFRAIILCGILTMGVAACVSSLHVEDIDGRVSRSPIVEGMSKDSFAPRTPAKRIDLYYKGWNALTRPAAVKDWEYHFVMGTASSPDWAYHQVARVEIYQTSQADAEAIRHLREIAHSWGGDALMDLHREPLIAGKKMPSDIVGYRYRAIVIRRQE